MRYQFGNVVVIEDNLIGVILKTFKSKNGYMYDVYVRSYNDISLFTEEEISHYIYSKELLEEQKEFY